MQAAQHGAGLGAELDDALRSRLAGVLSTDQMQELVPIVDEMLFLEARQQQCA